MNFELCNFVEKFFNDQLKLKGKVRRIDTEFIWKSTKFKAIAYTIIPKAGYPTLRIDIKQERIQEDN